MNALFYDLDRHQVLDWCGGMQDVRRRTIHTIGDPTVRFREDPIRILRAVKFAARLDLGIAPDVYDAMVATREDLAKAARPRLFEEILRLLRGGAAHRSMWLLWETGAMSVLLPELAAFLDDDEATNGGAARFFRKMDAIDAMTRARGRALDDVVLWTLASEGAARRSVRRRARQDRAPRPSSSTRSSSASRFRGASPTGFAGSSRSFRASPPGKAGRFGRTDLMGPALDVLEAELLAAGKGSEAADRMRAADGTAPAHAPAARPAAVRRVRSPRTRRGVE